MKTIKSMHSLMSVTKMNGVKRYYIVITDKNGLITIGEV